MHATSDDLTRDPLNESADTAIMDRRPSVIRTALELHRPAPGTCPRCGAAAFKRLKPQKGIALKNDRECKACGTPYLTIPAEMSITEQTASYLSGGLLILGSILDAAVQLADVHGLGRSGMYRIFFSVLAASAALKMPRQLREQREERLSEYYASALPGTPPPVELPRAEMEFLSVLFGIDALISPLISSLLLVILFAPAALVCGVVALCQGHRKALWGMVLALTALIVWGAVFRYCFWH
jgi:hypothetical protein